MGELARWLRLLLYLLIAAALFYVVVYGGQPFVSSF